MSIAGLNALALRTWGMVLLVFGRNLDYHQLAVLGCDMVALSHGLPVVHRNAPLRNVWPNLPSWLPGIGAGSTRSSKSVQQYPEGSL